jgi:hypothetical protein
LEVLSQPFAEENSNEDFLVIVRAMDWGRVTWELREFSGVAMRRVRVAEERQVALDEVRDSATLYGVLDNCEEIFNHWRDAKTWLVSGDLHGGGDGFELLAGRARLGNLLELLDREEVARLRGIWFGWVSSRADDRIAGTRVFIGYAPVAHGYCRTNERAHDPLSWTLVFTSCRSFFGAHILFKPIQHARRKVN